MLNILSFIIGTKKTPILFKDFLKKVSYHLVTTDIVLYSIGIHLNLQPNEITRIRSENPMDVRKAGEAMLHQWIRRSGITKFEDLNKCLKEAFSYSKLAEAFEDISAGKMRKIGMLDVIFRYGAVMVQFFYQRLCLLNFFQYVQ